MWDNVPLLRSITGALSAFSILAMLCSAAWYVVHRPDILPLHSVRLSAAPQHLITGEVLQVLRSEVNGNFFTVDTGHLRQALEKLPWVRGVSIRREFPNRLIVTLEEHQALAHWNDTALVNTHGEVFVAFSEAQLPEFLGQDGDSFEVAQRYGEFSRQLVMLNLQIVQLSLTPRHAWRVLLNNGMTLELGREEMQQRMARFVAVYPYSFAALGGTVKYVDLRYRNGFALGGANLKSG
ncbi:MAG TPA: cell division protein FtsQ/DivIB [Gallionella sp.]|jgi:cell division protein FtsQ|nr:cell division protein FtsQ/DivIB [Gallionella sp.]